MLLDQIFEFGFILLRLIGVTLRGLSQHSYLRHKINLIHFFHRGKHRLRYLVFLGLVLHVVAISWLLNHGIARNNNLFLGVEIGVDVSISTLVCTCYVRVDLDKAFYWSWRIRSIINIIKRGKTVLFTASTLKIKHAVFLWICRQHLGTIQPMEASPRDRYLPVTILILVNLPQIVLLPSDWCLNICVVFDFFGFRLNDSR